jgi:hypothetical protein
MGGTSKRFDASSQSNRRINCGALDDMARLIVFVCWICTLSSAYAQPGAPSLYEDLERQYANIIGAQVTGGVCPTRTPEVVERQRLLANALSDVSASTGPKVLIFAVTANSLPNVRRLDEAGASRIGDNGSPLHAAAMFADPPMLEYLIVSASMSRSLGVPVDLRSSSPLRTIDSTMPHG